MKIQGSLDYRKIVRLLLLTAFLALVVVRFSDLFAFAQKLLGLLTPLIIGCVIAFLVDLLVRPFERVFNRLFKKKKKLSRPLAILLAVIIVVALFFGVLLILIPQLKIAVEQFVLKLPVLFNDLESALVAFVSDRPDWLSAFTQVQTFFE